MFPYVWPFCPHSDTSLDDRNRNFSTCPKLHTSVSTHSSVSTPLDFGTLGNVAVNLTREHCGFVLAVKHRRTADGPHAGVSLYFQALQSLFYDFNQLLQPWLTGQSA